MSISMATRGMITPAGGAGGTAWTEDEMKQIRDALGVDGDKEKSVGGVMQKIKAIADAIIAFVG